MGPLIILSGPSGSGKSTVLRRLLEPGDLPVRLSVSATTRPPRPGERDGVDYHFWTRERFEQEIREGAFLEWAQVHGNYYGTLRREVEPYRARGTGVLLDIDVQGAAQVRSRCPDSYGIFLQAPSLEVLEQRLRARGTESEEAIQRRLATARRELEHVGAYQQVVVNDDLDRTVAALRQIIQELCQRRGPCTTS
ncbi:MAG TPA: guanylate kinase [Gemmataceae bacterium]|nr:guanylate kinase [Gemmataceae bacterium]